MSDTRKDKNMRKFQKAWRIWWSSPKNTPPPNCHDFDLRWEKRGYSKRPSWWFNVKYYRRSRRKCKIGLIKDPLNYINWDTNTKPKEYWD